MTVTVVRTQLNPVYIHRRGFLEQNPIHLGDVLTSRCCWDCWDSARSPADAAEWVEKGSHVL